MSEPQENKKCRKITLDMILASTSLTRSSKDTTEAYLARVTHLHMQRKKIGVIEGLELCTNLKVLYLYDNQIEAIQNLNHQSILYYLYLQNNLIKSIPLLQMPGLRKLYLDENEIQVVTGLNNCAILEELHVARQRMPSFTSLQFEPSSLRAISYTLQVLEISGCSISLLTPFCHMSNLRKLYCRDNLVTDVNEVEAVICLPKLEEANFLGNPCCKMHKYRDIAIGASSEYLVLLDEIPILKHQQQAIRGLMEFRRKHGKVSNFKAIQHNMNDSSIEEVRDNEFQMS